MQEFEKTIFDAIEPLVTSEGYEVVDVEWLTESGRRILRVYIDRENGVNIDDCSRISATLEDVLDVQDLISSAYNLEVSSPGLERPLRTMAHFEKSLGKKVKVVTKEKIDNRKNYKGLLKAAENEVLTIEIDNQDFAVPFDQVQKARLIFEM